jgi:hypothetical protein
MVIYVVDRNKSIFQKITLLSGFGNVRFSSIGGMKKDKGQNRGLIC